MHFLTFKTNQSREVINLYTKVFADSEGQEEGESIGKLVSDLIATTNKHDIVGFAASAEEKIVGCIFFTRLTLPVEKTAFILSPVAIATDQQGTGIGQQLIRHGIEHLRSKGVELLFTYGDPAYYSKVGFQQISENLVKAPLNLSQPEGWLAQSLQNGLIEPMDGPASCVEALNKQEYW